MKAQNSLKGEKSIVGLAVLTHNTIVQGTGVAGGVGGGVDEEQEMRKPLVFPIPLIVNYWLNS